MTLGLWVCGDIRAVVTLGLGPWGRSDIMAVMTLGLW